MPSSRTARLVAALALVAAVAGFGIGLADAAPGGDVPIASTPETIWCPAEGLPRSDPSDCGSPAACTCVAGECRSR